LFISIFYYFLIPVIFFSYPIFFVSYVLVVFVLFICGGGFPIIDDLAVVVTVFTGALTFVDVVEVLTVLLAILVGFC
jgi:hypothetical protein